MSSESNIDDIDTMIASLYTEIMDLKMSYMTRRRKKEKNLEPVFDEIAIMEEEFYSITKMQIAFKKYQKASGVAGPNLSGAIAEKIKELKNNMGNIVSTIPKDQSNG